MTERLRDRVAAVTGAASGAGRAMAQRCASEGAAVLCADVNEDGLAETVASIEAAGGSAVARRTDVSRESDVEAMLREAVERFGRLDVLMNNAAIGSGRADWPRAIAINLEGVYHGLRHGAALLATQGGGAIVNTASAVALVALPTQRLPEDGGLLPSGQLGYVAAKAGIVGLTRQFAVAYGRGGVRVNAIAPGGIDTPMLRGGTDFSEGDPHPADAIHPLGRIGRPSEIAAAAVFLASDEAAFITGVVLPVDGGYTAM
ncbi:MAG: SDR family oxidoreductase [Chloroflexi bacterium]|nr:SDR family oxidoreductase [Chloroflexota bacterium]